MKIKVESVTNSQLSQVWNVTIPTFTTFGLGLLLFLSVGFLSSPAHADSPLTSTNFYKAYLNVPVVRQAKNMRSLKGLPLDFLIKKEPLGIQAAVVNAFGWKFRGQNNALRYASALAKDLKTPLFKLKVKQLAAHHLFVLGYLLAMDDYFNLKAIKKGAKGVLGLDALTLLGMASKKLSGHFSVQMVYSLALSQKRMKKSFCDVHLLTQKVLDNFPSGKRDLRPRAVKIIVGYTKLYKSSCKHLRPKLDPRYNQIYKVVRYRKWVVTGTQAGIVFFNARTGKIEKLYKAFISNTFVLQGQYLWAGTYRKVIRFDGTKSKRIIKLSAARGISLFGAPNGEIFAKSGTRIWQCDAQRSRCKYLSRKSLRRWGLHTVRGAYHVVIQKNATWSVSFMSSLSRWSNGRLTRYRIRSKKYPGSDPRKVIVTDSDQVIVSDFSNGFYFYLPRKDRFVRLPIVKRKASDAGVHVGNKFLWLLHYTLGLYLKAPGKPVKFFNLQHLEYMRSLFVEKNGTTVWVAGWNQLIRFDWKDGKWKQRSYRVGKAKK